MEKIAKPERSITKAKLDARLAECNADLAEKKLENYVTDMESLLVDIDIYNNDSMTEYYAEITAQSNPKEYAINHDVYTVYGVKEVRDKKTNLVTSVKLSTSERRIDLLNFCKTAGFGTEWYKTLDTVKQQIALRDACLLANADTVEEQVRVMTNCIKTNELYCDIWKLGQEGDAPNPISNTQILKNLQCAVEQYLGRAATPKKGTKKTAEKQDTLPIVNVLKCDVQHLSTVIVYDKKQKCHKTTNVISLVLMFSDVVRRILNASEYKYPVIKAAKN